MQVFEAMTPDVHTVAKSSSIRSAAQAMRDMNIGMLPIVEDGKPVGIVTDRDLAVRAIPEDYDASRVTVDHIMTREPVCIYEDEDLDAAIDLMCRNRISRLLVMSRQRNLVGVLASADIASIAGEDKVGELMQVLGCNYWRKHLASARSTSME